jgi:hypothetical protein
MSHTMKKILFCLALLLWSFSTATAQDVDLRVDAAQELGTISPYVYGTNLGLQSLISVDMMPVLQELGLKYTRYGGGVIDQQSVRKPSIDLFIIQSRQLGAEPAITVRLLGGTPEEAAAVVQYVNIEKEYNVRYWSIGNEPNFFVAVLNAPSYTTEDLNREWRAMAEAMLEVDPNIILVGPDISQYVPLNYEPGNIQYLQGDGGGDPTDDLGKDWLQEFLKANGDLIGVVSIHRYPYPGGSNTGRATVEGLRENSKEWDTIIPNLRQIIHDVTGRDIPIAVTEINSNSSNNMGSEASLESFYNAIWMGDVLGRMIRNQVEIVAFWDTQGDPSRGWSLVDRYEVRPVYYTYLMYSHFGQELLSAESVDPNVSIYAAKRDDGALTLMVINMGDDEVTKTLQIDNFTPAAPAEVWRFDAEHNADQIDAQELGGSITVPGRSMTIYVVTGE